MLICMRTTLNLDDNLIREAKRLAAEKDTTLTALIEESLRAKLESQRPPKRTQFTTAGGGWLHAGLNIDNNALTRDVMDGFVDHYRR
jgi:hypothetical protein